MAKFLSVDGLTTLWSTIKTWTTEQFVKKETGKGLSANDYTTTEKEKLGRIADGAEVNVQSDWNVTDANSDAYIANKPNSLPANGGDADTVGGHTVEVNVPAGAKFTDTTYSAATASEDGLMTKTDFAKLGAFGEASEYSKTTEVETLITGKGYQTSAQVESAIAAKGYQTSAQVQAAIAAAGHLEKEIVTAKPADADAADNKIYMVPNGSEEADNIYDEYMKINGKLERIGSTKVDLSNYLQQTDAITDAEIDAICV